MRCIQFVCFFLCLLQSAVGFGLLPQNLVQLAESAGVDKLVAKKCIDHAEEALRTYTTTATNQFLTPQEWTALKEIFRPLSDVEVEEWGGFSTAERCKLFFSPNLGIAEESKQEGVAVLEASGNFLFSPSDHRDWLGAIMSTGIKRELIGDIQVLGDTGAHFVVDPSLVSYFCSSVGELQVRSVPVTCRVIEQKDLQVRPHVREPKRKSMTVVEASLRVDAVASAGMGLSRSKLAKLIKEGKVFINWKEVNSSSAKIGKGDTVTVRGKGRLTVEEWTITKKGRYRIDLERYS
ncbi:unnamed protein product [Chrysoparadoxa australica]